MSARSAIAFVLGLAAVGCAASRRVDPSDAGPDGSPPAPCGATGTCYVAPDGDDQHAGALDRPLRTISRCAETFADQPGTCSVRAGDYRETVHVGSHLTIQAYDAAGTPERVTIRGSDALVGLSWVQVRPNVWRATRDLASARRRFEPQLAVDGTAFVEARWPDVASFDGLLDRAAQRTAEAGTGPSHIVDAALPPNLIGGVVHVVGGVQYGAHTGLITAQAAGAFDYTADQGANPLPSDLAAAPGSRYFVANLDGLLDAAGEWFYDAAAMAIELYLPAGKTPADVAIEVKMRDYGLDLAGTSNATIKNIGLFMASVHMDPSSTNNVLDGLRGVYVSHHLRNLSGPYDGAVYSTATTSTGLEISGQHNTLVDSSIKYSAGHGISVFGDHHTIRNNRVYFTDYASVYAYSLYLAPDTEGHRIERNTLRKTGRSGLGSTAGGGGGAIHGTMIGFNDISDFGLTTEDDGGMYFSNIDGATPSSGPNITDYTRIVGNHVHDAYFVHDTASMHQGIYFDCASRGFVITHNVVTMTGGGALQFSTCGGAGGGYYMTANSNTFAAGQGASIGVYAPSPGGLGNSYFSNNVMVVAGGICAGAACDPTIDYGAAGYGNWHGDPGFVSGSFQLGPGSGAIGAATAIWTDNAFEIDWRCPQGVPGCANPAAPSFGAYNAGGYVFSAGSTISD